MKLELKHLAPYLPYGLKIQGQTHGDIQTMKAVYDGGVYTEEQCLIGLSRYGAWADIFEIKPILRPLSDLTKEIEIDGEKFVPTYKICSELSVDFDKDCDIELPIEDYMTYIYINALDITKTRDKLVEWHFDVFGLIEKGLAIDINTIKL